MTLFQIIILMLYWNFSYWYVTLSWGIRKERNKLDRLLIAFLAMTFGVLLFPAILAEDIYKKLNK